MERRVIKGFTDKKTKQPYPRGSKYETVDKKRIKELVDGGYLEDKDSKTLEDAQNDFEEKVKAKHKVETADDLPHIGGGYYELPNGEKVKGKENALKAVEKAGE